MTATLAASPDAGNSMTGLRLKTAYPAMQCALLPSFGAKVARRSDNVAIDASKAALAVSFVESCCNGTPSDSSSAAVAAVPAATRPLPALQRVMAALADPNLLSRSKRT